MKELIVAAQESTRTTASSLSASFDEKLDTHERRDDERTEDVKHHIEMINEPLSLRMKNLCGNIKTTNKVGIALLTVFMSVSVWFLMEIISLRERATITEAVVQSLDSRIENAVDRAFLKRVTSIEYE